MSRCPPRGGHHSSAYGLTFWMLGGVQLPSQDRTLQVTKPAEDFMFSLPQRPEIVRIDPDVAVFAKINFRPPAPMLAAQIKDTSDVAGRLDAISALAGPEHGRDGHGEHGRQMVRLSEIRKRPGPRSWRGRRGVRGGGR